MSEKIIVISSAHTGYRRAGVELQQGSNTFDASQFNEQQLAQLCSDPRLTIAAGDAGEASPDAKDAMQGTVDADRLAELVAHIRTLDRNDTSIWKEDGTPKASAFPKGTNSDERQAAWDEFTEALDKV